MKKTKRRIPTSEDHRHAELLYHLGDLAHTVAAIALQLSNICDRLERLNTHPIAAAIEKLNSEIAELRQTWQGGKKWKRPTST